MPTRKLISSQTLTSGVTYVDFSGFSGYKTLELICSGSTASNSGVALQFNGDTANNYGSFYFEATTGGMATETYLTQGFTRVAWNGLWRSGTVTHTHAFIFGYSNSTTFKSIHGKNTDGNVGSTEVMWGSWRSTAAITSMRVLTSSGVNFSSGSTFSLYGWS
jgi:hypothetical protein